MIGHGRRSLIAIAFLLPVGSLAAQVPPDSVQAWAEQLRIGDARQRIDAASRLSHLDPPFPPEVQDAVVAQLNRVNALLLEGLPVPEREAFGDDAYGEFYIDLTVLAAQFRTPEADRALIPAVGVSRGVQKRAARQGDEAVPVLSEMIERGHEVVSALNALALAWFWADSTGAPLSAESRRTIIQRIVDAGRSDDEVHGAGGSLALSLIRDPAWLPLARSLDPGPDAPMSLGLGWLRSRAIPALEAEAAAASSEALARSSRRMLGILCVDAPPGPRRGACRALENQFDTALRHLEAGRTGPARNALEAVVRRADQALAQGALTEDEHALAAGGAALVLERL